MSTRNQHSKNHEITHGRRRTHDRVGLDPPNRPAAFPRRKRVARRLESTRYWHRNREQQPGTWKGYRYELSDNGLGNAQTDTPLFSPRLKTYEGRQYYAYWMHNGDLIVAARNLPDGEWKQYEIGIEIGRRDGHWAPAVGVGPDGHVFLSYNTRSSEIRWCRSSDPKDVSSFGEEQIGMTGQNESSATYPEFTRLLDGTLLFGYRQGGSGNGDWILNRWAADEGWELLQHPLMERAYDGETFNAYPWNLIQSNDGVLHYFFTWRGTGGVQTTRTSRTREVRTAERHGPVAMDQNITSRSLEARQRLSTRSARAATSSTTGGRRSIRGTARPMSRTIGTTTTATRKCSMPTGTSRRASG